MQFLLEIYWFVYYRGHIPILLADFKCSSAVLTTASCSTLGQQMCLPYNCKFRHIGQQLPDPSSDPLVPTSLLSGPWAPELKLYLRPGVCFSVPESLSLVYCPLGVIQIPCFFFSYSFYCDLKGKGHYYTEIWYFVLIFILSQISNIIGGKGIQSLFNYVCCIFFFHLSVSLGSVMLKIEQRVSCMEGRHITAKLTSTPLLKFITDKIR